jgi:2,3-bisphosphoglycerate-dependent phosphoglycerate mutase
MKLYLIRHAESTNNALWGRSKAKYTRTSDPDITDTGHRQAELLANHLADSGNEPRQTAHKSDVDRDYKLNYLYCSLMSRSLLTAEYIQQACDIPLTVLPNIFERKGLYEYDENGNMKGIEGPGRSYFETRFPTT